MKIAICDDNNIHITVIENFLKRLNISNKSWDIYKNGETLVDTYLKSDERYDVIFLDMEMNKLNGIETGNKIREIDEHVIIVFVTSYTEYMKESFKCLPFRFLVKPIEYDEFETVFRDICKKISKQRKILAFTENKTMVRLFCDDIIYCESQAHLIWIHTKEQKYKVRQTLNELYEKLDKEMLYRVHKSFIINFKYIKTIKENNISLYHCEKYIPISRSYKKSVLENYTNFLERNLYI